MVVPTIDVKRKAVYVGTGNNYSDPATRYGDAMLAFDLETGSMRWSKQMNSDVWNFGCAQPSRVNCPETPDRDTDIGASPILRSLPGGKCRACGRDRQVHGTSAAELHLAEQFPARRVHDREEIVAASDEFAVNEVAAGQLRDPLACVRKQWSHGFVG